MDTLNFAGNQQTKPLTIDDRVSDPNQSDDGWQLVSQQMWPAGQESEQKETFDATPQEQSSPFRKSRVVPKAESAPVADPAKPVESKEPEAPNAPPGDRSLQWLERAMDIAKRTDTKAALERVLEGQVSTLNLVELITNPETTQNRVAILEEMNKRVSAEKWQEYLRYLDPALAEAELGLAKIKTGDDLSIAQGEKNLLSAVASRPDLQFNQTFQRKILIAYQQMEIARKNRGAPAWQGELKVEGTADNTIATGANPGGLLAKANETYQEKGIKEALPQFEAAIDAANLLPEAKIKRELLDLFCKRLTIERTILGKEVRGEDVSALLPERNQAKSNEWAKYRDYLSPATMRVNTALTMLADGDPELVTRAKRLLGEAISKRPEIEFDEDYQKNLKQAFEAHYQNRPARTNPENPGSQPAVPPKPFEVPTKPISASNQAPGQTADIDDMPKIESYTVDTITGPVLTAALLYLGYRTTRGRIESFRARRATATARDIGKRTAEAAPARSQIIEESSEARPAETPGNSGRPAEVKPGETPPGNGGKPVDEVKPGETTPGNGGRPVDEVKPGETTPGNGGKPGEVKPVETPGNGGRPAVPADELPIRTSPFESGQPTENTLTRPTAMEANRVVEVNLPGGIVCRIAKTELPKFMEKVESEFKSAEISKVMDEIINDKQRPEEERRQVQEMKEKFEKLSPEAREECKIEFFRTARTQLGMDVEAREVDQARTSRVGRALAVSGTVLAIGIISAAVLRSCLQKEAAQKTQSVQVEFIKK